MKQKLSKWMQFSWQQRLLLLEASVLLGVFRIVILVMPFRRLTPILGEPQQETETSPVPLEERVQKISWAIMVASYYLPWECKCLVQAFTGKIMLSRRGYAVTTYFGTTKDENNQLLFHAWLRYHNVLVTGGPNCDHYQVLSTFA